MIPRKLASFCFNGSVCKYDALAHTKTDNANSDPQTETNIREHEPRCRSDDIARRGDKELELRRDNVLPAACARGPKGKASAYEEERGVDTGVATRVPSPEATHTTQASYHARSWTRGAPAARAAAQPGKLLKTSFGDSVKHRETERQNLVHKWNRVRQQPFPDISTLLHKRCQGPLHTSGRP